MWGLFLQNAVSIPLRNRLVFFKKSAMKTSEKSE